MVTKEALVGRGKPVCEHNVVLENFFEHRPCYLVNENGGYEQCDTH